MRLIETCSCGASLEVIYQAPESEYSRGLKREEKDANRRIDEFRAAHAGCTAHNQESERP